MTVWLSMDPAIDGGNALLALQPTFEKLYVIDCRIDYGLARTEAQLEVIRSFLKYRPSRLILEFDAQQKALGRDERLVAMATLAGFEIVPHLTRGVKLDAVFSVASMNQSLIKKEISIPWADEDSKRRMDPLVTQLRAWRPDLPTKKLRQDAVMGLWFGWRLWMQTRVAHDVPPPAQFRPSWMTSQPYRKAADLRIGA